MKTWLRYLAIRAKALILQRTVVDCFGNTYIVYGSDVAYIGRHIVPRAKHV